MMWMLGAAMSTAIVLNAGTAFSIEPEPTKQAQPASPTQSATTALPKKSASGKSLVVPDDQKKQGTVYHTTLTSPKQVTFTASAHKTETAGHSAGVIGYAVAGPADNPANLKAAAWLLPVKSLDTGNKTKNKNLGKAEWLDAEKCPDIVFTLKSVKDIEVHKAGGAGKSFKCTLVGELTMRGVTRELAVKDAILGFVPGSDKTEKVAKGDLLAIRCKYTVKLTDFGVTNDYVVKDQAVADDVEIDQSLTLATVPPEEQPERSAAPSGETPAGEKTDK